jgi:hypothetical protein
MELKARERKSPQAQDWALPQTTGDSRRTSEAQWRPSEWKLAKGGHTKARDSCSTLRFTSGRTYMTYRPRPFKKLTD